MVNLYTSSINYYINSVPFVRPAFNTPSTGVFLTGPIDYDYDAGTEIMGPIGPIYTQSFDNYSTIRTNTSLNNVLFTTFNLQSMNVIETSNSTKQFTLTSAALDYSKIQTFNSTQIQNYTKQFSLKNIRLAMFNLQTISSEPTPELSRQVRITYNTIARLQKIKFGKVERDKLLWLLRSKNIQKNKYEYWSSEIIKTFAPSGKGLNSSTEVLGSYFQKGTKALDQYGKTYTLDVIDYSHQIPQIGAINQNISGTIDEDGNVLPDKLIFLQKINPQDTRILTEKWQKRGIEPGSNRYTYFKEPSLYPHSTNYNTSNDSNEILGSYYDK